MALFSQTPSNGPRKQSEVAVQGTIEAAGSQFSEARGL
jgi:hypothetical protein